MYIFGTGCGRESLNESDDERNAMMFNRIFGLLLIATQFFFVSCHSSKEVEKKNEKAKGLAFIEGFVVQPVSLETSIEVPGTLKPSDEIVLLPEVSGRVTELHLPEGQWVKKGTLLVKLNDADLQAEIRKASAELKMALANQERYSELLKENGVSRVAFEQAELSVQSLTSDLEMIKVKMKKTEIVAPFDGMVGLQNVSVGAEVTPTTPIATLRAVGLKLDFSVPEKYASAIARGQKVQGWVQDAKEPFVATITATESGIDYATRSLKVRAIVDNKGQRMLSGAFVRVRVGFDGKQGAFMIPTQALILQDSLKKVFVSKEGKAKSLVVWTGLREPSRIEVVKGLTAGDTVIISGLQFIKPGMALKFSKVR